MNNYKFHKNTIIRNNQDRLFNKNQILQYTKSSTFKPYKTFSKKYIKNQLTQIVLESKRHRLQKNHNWFKSENFQPDEILSSDKIRWKIAPTNVQNERKSKYEHCPFRNIKMHFNMASRDVIFMRSDWPTVDSHMRGSTFGMNISKVV